VKKVQQKCGTCKWLRPRSDGKPFWHRGAYKCQWVFPTDFQWPESITEGAYGSPIRRLREGAGTYMAPGDGQRCPTWEQEGLAAGLGEESAANERTRIPNHER
jgi:hypothetical protein